VDAAAVDPPSAQHTVVSRATLLDPLQITLAGPFDFEVDLLTIEPDGTTGARKFSGPAIVSVLGGTASRLQAVDGSCRAATVLPEVAYVVGPGQIDEIRNQGPAPLHLQTTSLAPPGEASASSAPVTSGCLRPTAAGLTVAVLTHSTGSGPVRILSDGPSEIITGRVVVRPGATMVGWHSHPSGAVLASAVEGHFDLILVREGHCVRRHYLGGMAFWEAAGEVHDYRNVGARPATQVYVGFSSSRGPLAMPAAPPSECQRS
jgi:quercetin dioxygenase-like cupin family protein